MIQFIPINFKFCMIVNRFCLKEFLVQAIFIIMEVLIPEVIHGFDRALRSCLDNCFTGTCRSTTSDNLI